MTPGRGTAKAKEVRHAPAVRLEAERGVSPAGGARLHAWPALSLRQPWLWSIFVLGKRIENRRRLLSKYRGPIWLHASKGWSDYYCLDALKWMRERDLMNEKAWPGKAGLDLGGICGYAEIVNVIEPLSRWRGGGESGRADVGDVMRGMRGRGIDLTREELRWWMPQQFGFVLRNVRTFPTLYYPGSLGLFKLNPGVEAIAKDALDGKCPCDSDWDMIGGGHLPTCRFANSLHDDGVVF